MRFNVSLARAGLVAALLLGAAPAFAQSCGDDPSGFPAWLDQFKQEAAAQGI